MWCRFPAAAGLTGTAGHAATAAPAPEPAADIRHDLGPARPGQVFFGVEARAFICCSATIANPRELAEALTGEPFELVERNGAPRGEKFFVFYNPPVVNRSEEHTSELQ